MDNVPKKTHFQMLLASMVHDMKNSLGILFNTMDDVMNNCATNNCPSHDHISKMKYEAVRLNYNLIQLLTLYKMDNDQFSIDISLYPVSDLVEESILQNKPLLDCKNIEIVTEYSENLMWFFDYDLILGVLNNVLNNAFRYAKSRMKIKAVEIEGMLAISIEDDGEGYPDEMVKAGAQTNKGVSFKSGSTGLGLYFASAIGILHKNKDKEGFISLSNGGEYGGGCFTIALP